MTEPIAENPSEHKQSCWLCRDLKGVAIHYHWTAQRGEPLWTAHKPASRSHPTRDCPVCMLVDVARYLSARCLTAHDGQGPGLSCAACALVGRIAAVTDRSGRTDHHAEA